MSISNQEIRQNNKMELRKLENMYVNDTIDNLDELIQAKKEELTTSLEEYQKKCVRTHYTKDGEPYKVVEVNPFVIQKYFFQSINPLANKEPHYNAEKLGIVWGLYQDIVCEVNVNIGDYTPTLTSFCTFAGITLSTFRTWKNSTDQDMRVIVEKINDLCFDANITLAQKGKLKERSTIYRMKSEQERAEKEQPQIHIHNESTIDFEAMKQRLEGLSAYNRKKEEVIEVENIEQ